MYQVGGRRSSILVSEQQSGCIKKCCEIKLGIGNVVPLQHRENHLISGKQE